MGNVDIVDLLEKIRVILEDLEDALDSVGTDSLRVKTVILDSWHEVDVGNTWTVPLVGAYFEVFVQVLSSANLNLNGFLIVSNQQSVANLFFPCSVGVAFNSLDAMSFVASMLGEGFSLQSGDVLDTDGVSMHIRYRRVG